MVSKTDAPGKFCPLILLPDSIIKKKTDNP